MDMIWSRQDITEFLERVASPGEQLKGLDDRILFDDALNFAKAQGDDGESLLGALLKMDRHMARNGHKRSNAEERLHGERGRL
jgi:hypothetical protein